MAYTQTDLDNLEASIKQGALTVRYKDHQVTYRSLEEMLKIRDLMRKELGLVDRTQRVFAKFSKGLRSTSDE